MACGIIVHGMAAYSGNNCYARESWEYVVLCIWVANMTLIVILRHAGRSLLEVVSSLLVYMFALVSI